MTGFPSAADPGAPLDIQQVGGITAGLPAGSGLGRRSVRVRLLGTVIVGAVLTAVVGVAGLGGIASVNRARGDDLDVTDVQVSLARIDADRQAIESSTLETVLGNEPGSRVDERQATRDLAEAIADLRDDFTEAVSFGLAPDLQAALWDQWPHLSTFVTHAQQLATLPATDANVTGEQVEEFDAVADQTEAASQAVNAKLEAASLHAEAVARQVGDFAHVEVIGAAALALVLLIALAYALGRSIMRSLRGVGETAVAITAGDLDARTSIVGDDEIGMLGRALNQMAESLRALFTRLGEEARRDAFGSQLAEAFEIADTLPDTYGQVEHAMGAISGTLPMELLLADSSQAHMQQRAVHPTTGAPGCPVQTPYECVAVRRGGTTVFDSSEALNACPKLRGRPYGACSAVCVPVTFMGRALGVLHTTGPNERPPTPEHVARLSALAAQAGSTIGTVRSTETTVRQATTDGLTGLANRRTLENEMRVLIERREPFAIAMADLDHFKQINDTYGHEAGDRALRLFSQVVRTHLRADDIVGRYGGEEFVFLFPRQTVGGAHETLERLRAELASAQSDGSTPRFTASYGLSDSQHGGSMDEMLRVVDEALARAKHAGRDRIVRSDFAVEPSEPGTVR